MRPHLLRRPRGPAAGLVLCLGLSLQTACAARSAPPPSPAEIRSLETRAERRPEDVAALVELGAGYRAAGRAGEAVETLERAIQRDPGDRDAILLLGLAYEDAGAFAQARQLYLRFAEDAGARDARLRRDVRRRIRMLELQQLRAEVRASLAREATLVNTPPQTRTVAVFPFRIAATDSTLEPLGRAMAELLSTDLSQTDRLTVLERMRVQLLLDEIQLAEAALVDSASAARGGRLLGAERVVQGTVGGGGEQVRLDAAIVQVGSAAVTGAAAGGAGVRTITEADAMQRLFDVEKRLALRLYESMGIELTEAERERVNRRPTENLQALLAYGRGLQALDAGNFALAIREFASASSLDPGFAEASRMAETSEELDAASSISTDRLASFALMDVDLEIERVEGLIPDPSGRDATSEVLGTEDLGRTGIIELIFRRPTSVE